MLDGLRRGANTIFVKILLGVLVLSFAVWGMGDFSGGGASVIAKVGNKEISMEHFQSMLHRELQTRPDVDPQLARYFLVQRLVRDSVLDQSVDSMKMRLGEDVIIGLLKQFPSFKNDAGTFDQEVFRKIIHQAGFTEERFLALIEKDEVKKMLLQSLTLAAPISQQMVDLLFTYRYEHRVLDIVSVPTDHVKNVPEPSDTDLVAFHESHPEFFKAPEFRTVKYALLNCNLDKDKKLPQTLLTKVYDDMVEEGNFLAPEARLVKQMLFTSKEEAKNALIQLQDGMDFDKVVDEITEIKMSRDGTIADLSAAIFNSPIGNHTDVVKSPLGWHIFYIAERVAEAVKPLESVIEEVEHAARLQLGQCDFAEETFANMEDEFAGGAELEEIVQRYSGKFEQKLVVSGLGPISAMGTGSSGKAVDVGFPDYTSLDGADPKEHFLEQIYALRSGDDPVTYSPNEGVFVALELVNVTPERVRALDELRGLAAIEWKKEKASDESKKIAEKSAMRVQGGGNIQEAANKLGLKVAHSKVERPRQKRDTSMTILSSRLLDEVFAKNLGETTQVYQGNNQHYSFATLRKVIPANTLSDKEIASAKKAIKDELKELWEQEVMGLYLQAMQNKFPVEINESAVIGNSGQGGDNG